MHQRLQAVCAAALVFHLTDVPPVGAQGRDPLAGAVADLRVATASVPTTAGWTPLLPEGGIVPSRGFGGSAGIQLLVGPGRHKRLGVGLVGVAVQGRSSDLESGVTVTSRLLAAGPHVTANFGHRLGWSYVGGGVALARFSARPEGDATPALTGVAFHYGGGARWFVTERVAVSMDLRFWALTPQGATANRPNAPATTKVAFGVGVAVR